MCDQVSSNLRLATLAAHAQRCGSHSATGNLKRPRSSGGIRDVCLLQRNTIISDHEDGLTAFKQRSRSRCDAGCLTGWAVSRPHQPGQPRPVPLARPPAPAVPIFVDDLEHTPPSSLCHPVPTPPPRTHIKMAMQALRENAKKGLKIGMIAGDGIGRIVLPVSSSLGAWTEGGGPVESWTGRGLGVGVVD